jgi:hypothetical protein
MVRGLRGPVPNVVSSAVLAPGAVVASAGAVPLVQPVRAWATTQPGLILLTISSTALLGVAVKAGGAVPAATPLRGW